MAMLSDEFMEGLGAVAHENGFDVSASQLEDGFTEITFRDQDTDEENELVVDVRIAGAEYQGRLMLEVRAFGDGHDNFFISPIPYVLFGAVYCEV